MRIIASITIITKWPPSSAGIGKILINARFILMIAINPNNDYRELTADFEDDFEVKDLKADYKDLKIHNADIAPSEVDWSNKEVTFR